MAILVISLVMALAMMAAAARTLDLEHRGEMYRRLRDAGRGHFKDSYRN